WKGLPDKMTKNLAASCNNSNLEDASKTLRQAELSCRLIPGGILPSWDRLPFGPPEGLPRLRWQALMLEQARRAVQDHWLAEKETDVPYYVHAAKAYAGIARVLATSDPKDPITIALKDEADRFAVHETKLEVETLSNPNWTSEQKFPLKWLLKAQKD